ncbi:MAG: AlbA family DNA-binding domain-containing protein, partial [Spirochaetales bacterium]
KREGSYWDFKKVPYTNNSDLLIDIICMANAITKCNKYIIIGVSDPATGCDIVGLDRAATNRKTQNQYIDFIRTINFAADRRPEIELRTLIIYEKEVDVIIIFDRPEKPYYLSSDKEGVRANYIYSRNGDTNTPRNKSTDYGLIEKMWREKFGIDQSPKDRMIKLLEMKNEWNADPGNKKEAYCDTYPEYTIEFSETREGWEPYSHYYPNPRSYFGEARFKYFSTTLFTCGYVFLDEYRIALGTPEIGYIENSHNNYYYYYFRKDSIPYKLSRILNLDNISHFNPLYRPFLLFYDKDEQIEFNSYLISNIDVIINEKDDRHDTIIVESIKRDGKGSGVDILMMGKIIRWYNKWKIDKATNLTTASS